MGIYANICNRTYWDGLYSQNTDPFNELLEYEQVKRDHTLEMIPSTIIEKALEIGCGPGQLTRGIAQKVGHLVASDISPVALQLAKARCAGFHNVTFRELDLVCHPVPGQYQLIVCSEVLYYLGTQERLRYVAEKLASALCMGGYLLLTHAKVAAENAADAAFNWEGHTFGADGVGRAFGSTPGLYFAKELRTSLYSVQLFIRAHQDLGFHLPAVVEERKAGKLGSELERTLVVRSKAPDRKQGCAVPILAYHRIASDGPACLKPYRTSPQSFIEQIEYLRRNGYYSLSTEQWFDARTSGRVLPRRPIIITFDDGYIDFYDVAWPILRERGFSATVFVVTDRVGMSADWDCQHGEPARLMNWPQIRELSKMGVEFGSHTARHQLLTSLHPSEVWAEGERSCLALRRFLGRAPMAISYPWGTSDASVREELTRAGYKIGVSTRFGFASRVAEPMDLPRIEILESDLIEEFVGKLMM